MARDARHAARAHAGARQARGGAGAARAAAPARRPAPHRARWETLPLPAPDGSGALVVALDLQPRGGRRAQRRRARASRSRPTARSARSRASCWPPCATRRPGGDQHDAAGDALDDAARRGRGARDLRSTHGRAPTSRRPPQRRGRARRATRSLSRRSTPVNAWWGSFDLAVSLFSGAAVEPGDDFIMRNAGDAEQVEVGLVARRCALSARRLLRLCLSRARRGSRTRRCSPAAAHWDADSSASSSWTGTTSGRSPHASASSPSPSRRPVTHARVRLGCRTLAASARGRRVRRPVGRERP